MRTTSCYGCPRGSNSNSTNTLFWLSSLFPCLMALMTDSRTATPIPVHGVFIEVTQLADVVAQALNQIQHVEVAGKLKTDRMPGVRHFNRTIPGCCLATQVRSASATSMHQIARESVDRFTCDPCPYGSKALLYSSRMSDAVRTATTIEPGGYVQGSLRVPGDKSVSHRYAILAALARGRSAIRGYAPGADCATTLQCLRALGAFVDVPVGGEDVVTIEGVGATGLRRLTAPLDARNSGTTMRLMAGVLAAHPFDTTITGDASLRRRPMRRIVEPLQRMGAIVETHDGLPPLTVRGGTLTGVLYEPDVASAQVKSAVLLAGLFARGETWVRERPQTRDHTERALPAFGAEVWRRDAAVGLPGGQRLTCADVVVPGDFSSAAFWLVAAAALPGSEIEISHVGLNPTRIHLLDVLRSAGAKVVVTPSPSGPGEPFGTVRVTHDELHPMVVTASDVPSLIDELPALAVLGVHGRGLRVSGAAELRAKESDRIAVLVSGLRKLGANVDEYPDGFDVHEGGALTGGTVDASSDHRMAMAFAIAALGATGPTTILGHDVVDVSYPGFFETLGELRKT